MEKKNTDREYLTRLEKIKGTEETDAVPCACF